MIVKHPHQVHLKTTVLLVNLGTPSHNSYRATQKFLQEFLSDPRVIKTSRWLWYPILYGIILPFRSRSSQKKYAHIYDQKTGMPLMYHSRALQQALQTSIAKTNPEVQVELAMRYGEQSIGEVLAKLQHIPHRRLIILPLFPQYSATTSASVFDEVAKSLKKWNFLPNLHFIRDYCDHHRYIQSLTTSIQKHWQTHGRAEKLLLSYHGLPEIYLTQGDPYSCYCHKTTRLISEALALPKDDYMTVFQSRFGPKRWLQPYTEETIITLAKQGVQTIDMIAPSFSVDCLETIDEITREYQEIFVEHGGKSLRYIPALNATADAVATLQAVLADTLPSCQS